jgi:hypothetical protein
VNEASARDVATLMRDVYPCGPIDLEKGCAGTLRDFLDQHIECAVKLLSVSTRPTQALIKAGLQLAFETVSIATCTSFVALMASAISYARNTKKSVKSGTKLTGPMLRLVRALDTASTSPLKKQTQALEKRKLKKHVSDVSVVSIASDVSSVAPSTAAASHGASSSAAYQKAFTSYFEVSPARNTRKIAKTAVASAPSSTTAAKPLEYIDSCQNALVRLYPDGRLVVAAMAQGPNGFGIARFGDEAPVETELPNLLLEPVTDAKAPRVLKKPSALAKPPPPAKTSANTSASYEKMYYAKQKRMATRRRHGDRKQIFQFGTDSMPRAEMDAIADFFLGALASGELTEDEARKYARDETRDTHASSARARPHSTTTDDQSSQCSSLRRHARTRSKRAQTT